MQRGSAFTRDRKSHLAGPEARNIIEAGRFGDPLLHEGHDI